MRSCVRDEALEERSWWQVLGLSSHELVTCVELVLELLEFGAALLQVRDAHR